MFASSQEADPLSKGTDAVEEESGTVLMCSLICFCYNIPAMKS